MRSIFWLVNSTIGAQKSNGAGGNNNNNFVRPTRQWTDGTPPPPAAKQRWSAEVCGARVVEVDLRTEKGLKQAKAAVIALLAGIVSSQNWTSSTAQRARPACS